MTNLRPKFFFASIELAIFIKVDCKSGIFAKANVCLTMIYMNIQLCENSAFVFNTCSEKFFFATENSFRVVHLFQMSDAKKPFKGNFPRETKKEKSGN